MAHIVEISRKDWRHLVSFRCRHTYYQDGVCRDFSYWQPDRTRELFDKYQIKFLEAPTGDGFDLWCHKAQCASLIEALDSDPDKKEEFKIFYLHLELKNLEFWRITDMKKAKNPGGVFYFQFFREKEERDHWGTLVDSIPVVPPYRFALPEDGGEVILRRPVKNDNGDESATNTPTNMIIIRVVDGATQPKNYDTNSVYFLQIPGEERTGDLPNANLNTLEGQESSPGNSLEKKGHFYSYERVKSPPFGILEFKLDREILEGKSTLLAEPVFGAKKVHWRYILEESALKQLANLLNEHHGATETNP